MKSVKKKVHLLGNDRDGEKGKSSAVQFITKGPADVPDDATSQIAVGRELGIDATK